ncbi:hypothetical protein [Streptomyces luteogriseus]|uniref:hypothetical protein n=1 Tax=Streptomyces luteogriseus TaxID=68233 RepID=UPI003801D557
MTFPDDDPNGKSSVTVRCQENGAVGVTFRDRFSFDSDAVHHAVEPRTPVLAARIDEVAQTYGESGYRGKWGEHFPRTEFEALRRLRRAHQLGGGQPPRRR